jgi:hypothetical protein
MDRKVIIQKVDLDTALTALICGVSALDEIIVSRGDAACEDLADPDVLCIEAGGSGKVHLNNFDHHNEGSQLPASCEQAFRVHHTGNVPSPSPLPRWGGGQGEEGPSPLARLVDYVAMLDCRPQELAARQPKPAFPTLSAVFSGMLLTEKSPREQLLKGMAILQTVLDRGLDPFGTMPVLSPAEGPELPEWKPWIEAKRQNDEAVRAAQDNADYFVTAGGLRAAFLESSFIGGIGALYAKGCRVVVMYNPCFGAPPVPKFTIAGNGVRMDGLLPELNRLEPGWGGRETIIGSPRTGSRLEPATVRKLVAQGL